MSRLTATGAYVFWWQNPLQGGMRFVSQLQDEIERADLFLLLLSPTYLTSEWCKRERDMAIHRENELERQFVYVCQVAGTAREGTGFLRSYDWIDLLPPVDDGKLSRVLTVTGLASPPPEPVAPIGEPVFRGRQHEISRVVDAVTTRGGQELWLVLSPPRMGKSWFLAEVEQVVRQREPSYATNRVDLRARAATLRTDWVRLLCLLLDVDPPASATLSDGDRMAIAAEVGNRSRPQLSLLDSAELLPDESVGGLRTEFSAIHRMVDRTGDQLTRLCLVVASRRQDPWRGFGPRGGSLPFEMLPLDEFPVSVLRQAIDERNPPSSNDQHARWADALHDLTEGLPALLGPGLDWVRTSAFLGHEAHHDRQAFEQVARSHIATDLLADESLLPSGDGGLPQRKAVLERAFTAIAPYRLFTQSHLADHVDGDEAFGRALREVGWDLADLWEALSRSALVRQPSEEAWQALSPPIRRLLFRHYYPDAAARLRAHGNAFRFYGTWALTTSGTDRSDVLIECLWHEANMLLLTGTDDLPTRLVARVAELTRVFAPPQDYSPAEFAGVVGSRLHRDREFAALVSPYPGLFEAVLTVACRSVAGGDPEPALAEVDHYVPRAEEEQVLAQVARVRADGRSRWVLLYGQGGVGKTRMVRALAARDGGDPAIRWVRPIDVDDSNYWLLENLQQEVAERLDPDGRHFEQFYGYLSQLPKYATGRIGRDTVSSHHNRMRDAFIECYERFLAGTGTTVVITLDTIETIRSMYLLSGLTQWMKALPGTLFVLSGRPTPGWCGRDTIREYLEDPRDPMDVVTVPVAGFGEADVRAFLAASGLGDSLSDAQQDRLAELTERRPLWLALAVDHLRLADLPPEMDRVPPMSGRLRESFRRRLLTRYRSTEFWPETIKRLAVVRHGMDQQAWRMLMADRTLPPGVADWDQAWHALRAQPWIRCRANDRYVTLHDAVADELGLRLIPLHDNNEQWRLRQWRRAAEIYDELVGDRYDLVLGQLAEVLETATEPDSTSVAHTLATLGTRKRELDQMRMASLRHLLLSDRQAGVDRFVAQFAEAAGRHDMHAQKLLCHELERFLPPARPESPRHDAIGAVIDRFHDWLGGQPELYLQIGLNIARFLIQNSQPRPALTLLDRLPEAAADVEVRYRFANERANALMRIPGQAGRAGEFFHLALRCAEDYPPPLRERMLAEALKELGFYSRNLGQWQQADVHYARAAEVIATIVGPGWQDGDREELASIRTNWAYVKALQGEYEDARNLVESAMALRRRLGSDHGVAVSMSVAGEVSRYDLHYAHAWELYLRAEALFVRLRNWAWLGLLLQEQAICLFQAHHAGLDLVDDPVEEAKQVISRALSICRDQAIRWYPSALNRAGRIFGQENPDEGLRYLDESITEARRVADGWFLSAGLIEYAELCYRVWTDTGDTRYRDRIDARAEEVRDAIREFRFGDLRGRWALLRGHLLVHDAVAAGTGDGLDEAIQYYSQGFLVLADRRVGSHGSAAMAAAFERFRVLYAQLPPEVRSDWYTTLRDDLSTVESGDRSNSLLARLEQLH